MRDVDQSPHRDPGRWLVVCALTYALLHHLGFAASGLGNVGVTRWADWLDLVTPYAVLLPAGLALAGAGATSVHWLLFSVGAISYANGHGIHLGANSIGNVNPSPVAHLWDEVIGHYVWYFGVALILLALAAASGPLNPSPPATRAGVALRSLLCAAVGITWATNGLEGGTAPLSLAVAAGFLLSARPLVRRGRLSSTAGQVIYVTTIPPLLILVFYGVWFGGFPQPSAL
jgi:hypothetical protein